MNRLVQQLSKKSYNRMFIWKCAIITLLIGFTSAIAISFIPRKVDSMQLNKCMVVEEDPNTFLDLKTQLSSPLTKIKDLIKSIAKARLDLTNANINYLTRAAHVSSRTSAEKRLLKAFLPSLLNKTPEFTSDLKTMLKKNPVEENVNWAAGWIYYSYNHYVKAGKMLETEAKLYHHEKAYKTVLALYRKHELTDEFIRVSLIPTYSPFLEQADKMTRAIYQRNYLKILIQIPKSMWEKLPYSGLILAVIGGIFWFIFLLYSSQPGNKTINRSLLMGGGIFCGILSIILTVFMIIITKDILNFKENGNFINDLLYFIFGVGLREELAKIICFIPLIPFLMKRRDQLEILIIAGCVGLGFAIEENISYIGNTGHYNVIARFLTANFLHISWTAIIGLALCRAVSNPSRYTNHFISTFGTMVIIHGLYDAFIVLPEFRDISFLSLVCIAYVAKVFFTELHGFRQTKPHQISFTFMISMLMAILLMVSFNMSVYQFGFIKGLAGMLMAVASSGIILILFFREFREV